MPGPIQYCGIGWRSSGLCLCESTGRSVGSDAAQSYQGGGQPIVLLNAPDSTVAPLLEARDSQDAVELAAHRGRLQLLHGPRHHVQVF